MELFCLPATYRLGNGADGVNEIKDFEPQRRPQRSASLAPNSSPVLCHIVKKVVVEANPAGCGKKVGLLSADPQQYTV